MISCVTGSSKPCVYCCSSWMLTTALKREKKYPRSYQNSKERNKEHRRVISANAGSCQHKKKKGILNRKMWNWQHRFKRHFRVDENHSGTESASSQHWSSLFAAAPGQAGTLPPPLSSISTCTWLLRDWGGSAMSSFNSSSVSYLWCFQGIPVQTAQAWPHNGASENEWMLKCSAAQCNGMRSTTLHLKCLLKCGPREIPLQEQPIIGITRLFPPLTQKKQSIWAWQPMFLLSSALLTSLHSPRCEYLSLIKCCHTWQVAIPSAAPQTHPESNLSK